jgi:toxin YoeB
MPQAKEDINYFLKKNKKLIVKIKTLHQSILNTPFEGIGKPEPLKHDLAGKWSRRISKEHRLVYEIKDKTIIIFQYRFHY